MTHQQKQELKNIIQIEIETLSAEITNIQTSLQPIKKDCSLDGIDHKMLKQDQTINFGKVLYRPILRHS